MKSPISLCMIVKNEPLLEKCLLSIKDFVSEIVILDTGSTDNTPAIAKKYADIFEVYTDCNDPETGLIEDFSKARQRSFELATQPWVMWCDGDDVIEGGENLFNLIEEYNTKKSHIKNGSDVIAFLFPYEYAYNEQGQCILRHYRERLLSNKNYFTWVNPVHEVIIPKGDRAVNMLPRDNVIFKHQRQFSSKTVEPGRNLRILKKYYEKVGDSDPRQLYYLGLEYCNNGLIEEAISHLIKYIELSGWEDERVMACLKLIDIYSNQEQYEKALPWAFKSIEIKENWSEGYLALGKLFYFMALKGGPYEIRNWQKCVHFSREGLKLPPTQTLLFVNPLDRDYFSHVYLNFALNKLGEVPQALESTLLGLKSKPDDKMLLCNKELYENFLSRQKVVESINVLKSNNVIDQAAVEKITAIINGLTISDITTVSDEIESTTLKRNRDHVLDVIFFLGDGVEQWSPETVKKTGIGGSELMALSMAKRLAILGHKVKVFNSCGPHEGIYDGVEYLQTHKYHDLNCDVLVVSRNAAALANTSVTAKLTLLWVHDIFAINATNELLLKADRILALTHWHKEFLIKYHNIHPQHIIVTRNGIDLNRFKAEVKRNRFKCVNSSSPDRSWPVLLEVWPKIKERVPQAELHLYYGFKNWEHGAQFDPKQQDLINYLRDKIAALKDSGVVFHDRVDQKTLANELLSAGAWVYPTWFTETSCQLAGSLIFTKEGMVPIEQIKEGDLVLTHKGRFREVTKLIKKEYDGNLYSLKRKKDFNPITLTEEHPIYAAYFNKRSDAKGRRIGLFDNKKVEWVTPNNLNEKLSYLISPKMPFGNLSEIYLSDYIDLPVENGMISRNHKNSKYKKVHNLVKLTPQFVYLLGLFAAEGCVATVKTRYGKKTNNYWVSTITFALHLREMSYAQKIIEYFGGKISQTSPNGICVTFYNSVWANFFKTVIGSKPNKKIPKFIWDCSEELQTAFINGLFDGDGCFPARTKPVGNGKVFKSYSSYTSISPSLAYGMSQLLSNQNLYPSITFDDHRKSYSLSWTNKPKSVQHRQIDEGIITRLNKITTKHYKGLVYNFEVDEDESYVTDRTIVHNCITAMEMQAAGVRMVTSNLAALKETAGDRAVLLDGDWTSSEYQNNFIEAVVEKLTNEDDSDRAALQNYAKNTFDLDLLAQQWEDMFYMLLHELKSNPIVPYFPTGKYITEKSYQEQKIDRIIDASSLVKLNIGAGPNIFPYDGWINYDRAYASGYFTQLEMVSNEASWPIDKRSANAQSWMASMTPHQTKLVNYLSAGGHIEYRIKDVQYPFNEHPDNSVDIIYLGQMIEHLNPIYTIPNLLKDCHRMLRPGGTLRITTPDLDLLIGTYQNGTLNQFAKEQPAFYAEADPGSQLSYLMFGACGPDCTWNNYEGHMFLFTKISMTKALRQAGFENITFFNSSHLTNNEIIKQEVTDEGISHSLLVEAIK